MRILKAVDSANRAHSDMHAVWRDEEELSTQMAVNQVLRQPTQNTCCMETVHHRDWGMRTSVFVLRRSHCSCSVRELVGAPFLHTFSAFVKTRKCIIIFAGTHHWASPSASSYQSTLTLTLSARTPPPQEVSSLHRSGYHQCVLHTLPSSSHYEKKKLNLS